MKNKKPVIGITTDITDEKFSINETYARTVLGSGGVPLLLPSIYDESFIQEVVSEIDGLILPGSRDMDPKFYGEKPHPELNSMSLERTEAEMQFLDEALEKEIPVLGICGGMQLIDVFFGGSLYQDIKSFVPDALSHEDGAVHDIEVEDGTLLSEIIRVKGFSTRSHHHQAVKKIGEGLRVSARTSDGIVEGVESTGGAFVLGIQWHPEIEESEVSERIFRAFVEKCRNIK